MQHQESEVYNFRWDQVFRAFWLRYPSPFSKHVLTEDVISRTVDKQGRLVTKKLLSKTNSAPKWTERFLPSKVVYIIEESIVDMKRKSLTTYTRNIGLKHLLVVEEKVVYSQNRENRNLTSSNKSVFVDSSVYGLSFAAKRFGLERYKQNIKKTYKGFNFTLESLFGIRPVANAKHGPLLNPVLKERLKEGASMASEFAKSKVPIVNASNKDE